MNEWKIWYHEQLQQGHYFYIGEKEVSILIEKIVILYPQLMQVYQGNIMKKLEQHALTLPETMALHCYYRHHGKIGFPIYNCKSIDMDNEMIKPFVNVDITIQQEMFSITIDKDGSMILPPFPKEWQIEALQLEDLWKNIQAKQLVGEYQELEHCVAIHQKDVQLRTFIEQEIMKEWASSFHGVSQWHQEMDDNYKKPKRLTMN